MKFLSEIMEMKLSVHVRHDSMMRKCKKNLIIFIRYQVNYVDLKISDIYDRNLHC